MIDIVIGFAMGAACFGLGYWSRGSGSGEPSIAEQIQSLKPSRTNNGAKAFGKPTGKRKPKVNDDDQAWRKEQDI